MTNKANVQKLIDHMRVMPDAAFAMDGWVYFTEENALDSGRYGYLRPDPEAAATLIAKQREAGPGEHPCGTAACIAGEAAILAMSEMEPDELARLTQTVMTTRDYNMLVPGVYVEKLAREFLDISDNQATDLFCGPKELAKVTKAQAIAVLEILRDTDEVDWPAVGVEMDDFSEDYDDEP